MLRSHRPARRWRLRARRLSAKRAAASRGDGGGDFGTSTASPGGTGDDTGGGSARAVPARRARAESARAEATTITGRALLGSGVPVTMGMCGRVGTAKQRECHTGDSGYVRGYAHGPLFRPTVRMTRITHFLRLRISVERLDVLAASRAEDVPAVTAVTLPIEQTEFHITYMARLCALIPVAR
jgi:hypothetical protein